jgi:hypothetical protein
MPRNWLRSILRLERGCGDGAKNIVGLKCCKAFPGNAKRMPVWAAASENRGRLKTFCFYHLENKMMSLSLRRD